MRLLENALQRGIQVLYIAPGRVMRAVNNAMKNYHEYELGKFDELDDNIRQIGESLKHLDEYENFTLFSLLGYDPEIQKHYIRYK